MKISNKEKGSSIVYLHLFQPDNLGSNYKFVSVKDFLKKKKNQNEDIFIGDLLEYFEPDECYKVFERILAKVTKGKKIIIQGVDIKSVASNFALDSMSDNMFNVLVFGLGKKQSLSFYRTKGILDAMSGIDIISIKFMNSIHYYIECAKV